MVKKALTVLVVLFALGVSAFFLAARFSTSIQITRTFIAPIDRVWSNFNDADTMKRWWSPKDYTAPIIKNDFRVGGTFFYSMRSPSGQMHYNTGTFTEIELNKKIVARMSFADETGKAISAAEARLPGKWPEQVEVKVEFEDLDGQKTKVRVTESGIPLIMSVFAKMGWEQQFDKFAKVVE